jgi:hypothetical protein
MALAMHIQILQDRRFSNSATDDELLRSDLSFFDNAAAAKRQSAFCLGAKDWTKTEALSRWSFLKSFEFRHSQCACALARGLQL